MTKGHYGEVLSAVFDILATPQEEREKTLRDFKAKVGNGLLRSLLGELSEEEQRWLKDQKTEPAADDPHIIAICEKIYSNHTALDLQERTVPIFRKLLSGYIAFRSDGLSQEKRYMLDKILK